MFHICELASAVIDVPCADWIHAPSTGVAVELCFDSLIPAVLLDSLLYSVRSY